MLGMIANIWAYKFLGYEVRMGTNFLNAQVIHEA
jgi:hypothetical protein